MSRDAPQTYQQLVQVLRGLREDQDLTREALASRLHITPTAVGHWEAIRHRPTPENLATWVESLGYGLGYNLTPLEPGGRRYVIMAITEAGEPRRAPE